MLARYNAWANERLYAAAATLPESEYRADRGVFFRSLHGTLNHLLVADRVWLRRLTGEGPAPSRLDEILYDDFEALRAARRAEDQRLIRVMAAWDAEALRAPCEYRNMRGEPFSQPRVEILAHLFNHQTHHRGQAHALLTGLGRDAPELDLVLYLRERQREGETT